MAKRAKFGNLDRERNLYFLQLLSESPDFIDALAEDSYVGYQNLIRGPIFLSSFDPWIIPSEDEVAMLDEYLRIVPETAEPKEFWKRVRYRWSAAAVAIRFLKSISTATRLQIRSIMLDEDRESVAYPECHGLGLIPFFSENPRLHITRHLSLWRNVLPAASLPLHKAAQATTRGSIDLRNQLENLLPDDVCKAFGTWMMEYLLLFAKGVPAHSLSLVFDGSPIPERSSEVFETVKRSVAWQTAWEQCEPYISTKDDPDMFGPEFNEWYTFREFPQALKDMIAGQSSISCNFSLGNMVEAQEILEQNRTLSGPEWWSKYRDEHSPPSYQTAPPLTPWKDLRLEDVISEE